VCHKCPIEGQGVIANRTQPRVILLPILAGGWEGAGSMEGIVNKHIACTTLLVLLAATAAAQSGAAKWARYRGCWFDISYPSQFKAVVRDRCATSGQDQGGGDGASFVSPDQKAEFYVYSPQWSGKPSWVSLRTGEKEVARRVSKTGSRTVTFVTVQGPKKSYYRSWADTEDKDVGVRLTYGYKYRDESARKKHADEFAQFKKSLKQFAD